MNPVPAFLSEFFAGRGAFFQGVATVVTGTVISRIIAFAAIPIVSRLYSPEDFGVLALFSLVYVLFVVSERGKVENPRVWQSTDPALERPALAAVKKWRFEPGKRNGKPVRFRMRCPITFPKT